MTATDRPAVTLCVRPIRYTARPDEVAEVLLSVGCRADVDHGDWRVFSAGAGKVAVHAMPAHDRLAGRTVFGLELVGASGASDLDAFAQRLVDVGVDATRFEADHGPSVRVRGAGLEFVVDVPTPVAGGAVPDPSLAVLPLVYGDVAGLSTLLVAVGLTRRIEADGGGWVDLSVPGGGGFVGVHGVGPGHRAEGPATVELHFEHSGSLDDVVARLAAAGRPGVLVDESWGHSVRIPDPDGAEAPDGYGVDFYVNAVQTDLYGYQRFPG